MSASVLTALAWLAVCTQALNEEFAASEHALLLARDESDRDVMITRNALALSRTERLERPGLFLLGASDLLEALRPLPQLSAVLAERGVGFEIHDLISHWQSLLDSAVLVEMLPARFDGVVVVMVGPKRIGQGVVYADDFGRQPVFHRRFGFRSDLRDRIAREAGIEPSARTGNYFLDNRHFLFPRLAHFPRNLLLGPPEINAHVWKEGSDRPAGEPERLRLNSYIKQVVERYEENYPASIAMLAQIAAALADRGLVQLVLLESPMSPRGLEEIVGLPLYTEHQARMAAFAAAHGALYWNLNPELAATDADYRDDQHLLTQRARGQYTDLLLRRLEPIFEAFPGVASR